jgi:hypothetical protein
MITLPLLAAGVLSGTGLVSLLVWLLILALLIYVVFLILGMLPLPEPAKRIVGIILSIIFLLVVLNHLGFAL